MSRRPEMADPTVRPQVRISEPTADFVRAMPLLSD
jgi:hypothetical protein